jgi:protein-tyrosine phosphatase
VIDIHSHILPGIDDGSRSMDETVELLTIAKDSGTELIVASPHSDSEYTYDHEKVDELIAEAQALAGDGIKIVRGCDFHLMFSNVNAAMEHPRRYTINNGPYILMELSDMMIFPNTSDIWRQLENYGIRIILTHPERNLILQTKFELIEKWVDEGFYMQVTAMSLLGMFGKKALKVSTRMLDKGMVHFVASDGHDPKGRPPRLDLAFQWVKEHYGNDMAELLFIDNPRAAVNGGSIDSFMPNPDRRGAGGFFGRLFGRG